MRTETADGSLQRAQGDTMRHLRQNHYDYVFRHGLLTVTSNKTGVIPSVALDKIGVPLHVFSNMSQWGSTR
jgi:hypothetical protein